MEVLVIIKNTSTDIKLVACKTYEEALQKMKITYDSCLVGNDYDFYNTFFDEDSGYAQIVSEFDQTEFRIGKLSV